MRQLLGIRWLLLIPLVRSSSALLRTAVVSNPKMSEAEWNSYFDREENGPGSYSFGYDVEDPDSGNTQFRQEERFPNGTVEGSYGLLEPDGNVKVVHYTADHLGYRVRIENSLRKNGNYRSRGTPQTTPAPFWISQKQQQNIQTYQKISTPADYIYNSLESRPQQPPQQMFLRRMFYPYYYIYKPAYPQLFYRNI